MGFVVDDAEVVEGRRPTKEAAKPGKPGKPWSTPIVV